MLRKLTAEVDALRSKKSSDPAFTQWRSEAEMAVRAIFGSQSPEDNNFLGIQFWSPMGGGDDSSNGYNWFTEGLSEAHAKLLAMTTTVEHFWEDDQRSSVVAVRPGGAASPVTTSDIFIVHGHDIGLADTVARYLDRLNLHPIILHEQANQGKTIIEKFEQHAMPCAFAIVLLTPDDFGGAAKPEGSKPAPRARQNVILELGYFLGRLGRHRVVAIVGEGVELPSDFHGVLYIPASDGSWKFRLAKQLKTAGLSIDASAVLD